MHKRVSRCIAPVFAAAVLLTATLLITERQSAQDVAPIVESGPGAPSQSSQVPPALRDRYQLRDVTVPEALDDRTLQHILILRELWGIPASADYVNGLYADPSGHGALRSARAMFANLLITSDDLPDVIAHADLEWRSQALPGWAKGELGDQFAGSYLHGGEAVVLCVGCDAEAVRNAALASDLSRELTERIRVRQATTSLAHLEDLQARVAAFVNARGAKMNGTGVRMVENDVIVRLGASSPSDLVSRLRAEFVGEPLAIVLDPGDSEFLVDKDQPIIYGIVEGGQAIQQDGSEESFDCTSGFSVDSATYGPFMMTAGHCIGTLTEQWNQGGSILGLASNAQVSGILDAALITTYGYRSSLGRVHFNSTNWFDSVTFVPPDYDFLAEGVTVCQTGAQWTGVTGDSNPSTRCGAVSSVTWDLGSPFSAYFIAADFLSQQGDSGGAVVWPTEFGMGAVGMVSQGDVNTNYRISTRVDAALYVWSLSLASP